MTSTIGKIISLVLGNRMMSLFNIPTHMMGMTQIALEDLWNSATSYNYSSHVNQLSTVNWTLPIMSDYQTLFLIAMMLLVSYYCIRRLPALLNQMGITQNIYISRLNKFIRTNITKQYSTIITDAVTQHTIVNKYLHTKKLFQDEYSRNRYFQHAYNLLPTKGNISLAYEPLLYIPALNTRFYFDDPMLMTNGYIIWSSEPIVVVCSVSTTTINSNGRQMISNEDKSYNVNVPVLKMVINRPVEDYISDINRTLNDSTLTKELFFCHVQSIGDGVSYTKHIATYEYRGDWIKYFSDNYANGMKKKWIDTFFHPSKNEIWPKVKTIEFSPETYINFGQYPQASFCLYGPPGTGKSTMVYRIAMALGRGIVSINLNGIKSTRSLRKILTDTHIYHEVSGSLEKISVIAKRVIYVFDEFDKAIIALRDRALFKEKCEKIRVNDIKRIAESFEDHVYCHDNDDDPKGSTNRINNHATRIKEIKESVSNLTTEDDDLTVDSILDVIQGCCSNNGSIIFAITNCYDKVREICPRLFRDGRFKPIYMGYPTRETIDEITQHYYNRSIKDITFIPDVLRISTSRIVTRAVDLKVCYPDDENKQFEIFMEHLKYDLEHHQLADVFREYEECIDSDLCSSSSRDQTCSPTSLPCVNE